MTATQNSPLERSSSSASSQVGVWVVVCLLAVWALLLRWPGLTAWWFNPDEAIYFNIATAPAGSVNELIRPNAHPPLYYWMLWVLARLNDSVVVMRLPALIAGVALVPAMFLLTRRYAGTLAGVLGALLVCLSPGAILMSQVLRPYALQVLCLTLALFGLLGYLQAGRRPQLALYLLAAGTALLLQYSTFIVLAGIGVGLGGAIACRRLERSRLIELGIVHALLLAEAALLYFTHIAIQLQGSDMQRDLRAGGFKKEFITEPGDALRTLLGATEYALGGTAFGSSGSALLSATFSVLTVGITVFTACYLALMLFGIVRKPRPGSMAVFLFPLAVVLVALGMSAVGQYPLGKSRHSFYLLVVFVPLVASGLSGMLCSQRRLVSTLGLVFLLEAAVVLHLQAFAGGLAANPPGLMAEATISQAEAAQVRSFLLAELPADALVITDWQTYQLLGALLGPQSPEVTPVVGTQLSSMTTAGRRFVFGVVGGSEPWRAWFLPWQSGPAKEGPHLSAALDELEADPALLQRLEREDLWFVQGGWAKNPAWQRPKGKRVELDFYTRVVGGQGLGAFLLDRAAYRAYLAEQ